MDGADAPFCIVTADERGNEETLLRTFRLLQGAHEQLEAHRAAAGVAPPDALDVRHAALLTIVESCLCVVEANVRCMCSRSSGEASSTTPAARAEMVAFFSRLMLSASPAIQRGAVAVFAACESVNFWFPSAEMQAEHLTSLLPAAQAGGLLLAPLADALCHPTAHIAALFSSNPDAATRVLDELLGAVFRIDDESSARSSYRTPLVRLLLVLQRRLSSKLARPLSEGREAPTALIDVTERYICSLFKRSAQWVEQNGSGIERRDACSSPVGLLLPPLDDEPNHRQPLPQPGGLPPELVLRPVRGRVREAERR